MTSVVKKAPSMEPVFLTKSEKDVLCLKKLARFVIEIDEVGNISVTNNQSLVIKKKRYAPIISVVGPFCSNEKIITVPMLEIGYQRARPYRRVHKDRNKILIQTRKADKQLSLDQFKTVYPHILKCLETVLIETKMRWKSSEPWFFNGRYYERGVQITVSKNDLLLYQALLQESIYYFEVAIIDKYIWWLNRRLKHSRFERYSNYGPSVKEAVESVMRSVYATHPFWMEVLLSKIKKGQLLRNVLFDLYNYHPEENLESNLTIHSETKLRLPQPENFFVWHTLDQPTDKKGNHAAGCGRFEIMFKRNYCRRRAEENGDYKQLIFPGDYHDDKDFVPF